MTGILVNPEKKIIKPHEYGDIKLCEVANINYSKYEQMELEEQLEIATKYLQETIDLILYENILTEDNDKYNLIDKYIPEINLRHINNCTCCDAIKLRIIDIKVKRDLIHEKNLTYQLDPNNDIEKFAQKEKKNIKNLEELVIYHIQHSKHFNYSLICPLIKKEMMKTFDLFAKDYDLSKAKVQTVVGGILSYQAALLESTKYFKENGLFEIKADKFGNPIQTISSNEYYKLKLNEKIIDAIKILDQMIEGNKNVNINLNQNSLSIEDVLKKFKM